MQRLAPIRCCTLLNQSMACLGLTFGLTLPSIGMLDVAGGLELAGTLTLRATPGLLSSSVLHKVFWSLASPEDAYLRTGHEGIPAQYRSGVQL